MVIAHWTPLRIYQYGEKADSRRKRTVAAATASWPAVKDTLDPCFFALFSDQEGVIYRATPLQ